MYALSPCKGPVESNFNSIQSPLNVFSSIFLLNTTFC